MKCSLWLHTDIMHYANGSVEFQDSFWYGDFDEKTNNYSGLKGDLTSGKVDVTGTPFFMAAHGIAFFQFVGSLDTPQVHFFFRKPSLSNTNNIFLLPFDEWVWTCTILMIIAFVVLLTWVVFVEWRRVSQVGL